MHYNNVNNQTDEICYEATYQNKDAVKYIKNERLREKIQYLIQTPLIKKASKK